MKQKTKQTVVPVVVSAMAQPFLAVALREGADTSTMLEPSGVTSADILEGKKMMSGQSWYDFIDRVAAAVDNPFLGFHIGSGTAIQTLPNLKNLEMGEATLGNLLTTMVIEAESLTTLADYELVVKGREATLRSQRSFRPSSNPVQADGYFAGFLYRLLRECCGDAWEPSAFKARICDPEALPKDIHSASRVMGGTRSGVEFRFPSTWLLLLDQGQASQTPEINDVRDTSFMSQVSMLLELHQSDPNITLETFAKLISLSPSEAKRQFAKHKTTFHRELDACRCARARRLLSETDMTMAQIGDQVGFPESSAFCRVFKRWEGMSPGKYRQGRSTVSLQELAQSRVLRA
ncbi:helix-turn-helix transcriptional regulator [Shimia haliotis]|uniref:AraC-type DNA-binding protein n=1 Tax=Shimia haliotis TaxID=1280847 RepID=A0A1I4DDD8_9RHOB|nr:AraC family transcriptional regulator [Shimia haliotis]SFK89941.1 AraC-type DNA-binding protein [Shimia haliotis]